MIVALQSMAELERALRGPAPVLIFKHSTACPISAAAYQAFQRFVAAHPAGARYYLVKVIEQRALSGEIARRLGVPHASPQALLWHRGGVRWHASHWAITEQSLAAALAGLRVGGREPAAAPGPARRELQRPGPLPRRGLPRDGAAARPPIWRPSVAAARRRTPPAARRRAAVPRVARGTGALPGRGADKPRPRAPAVPAPDLAGTAALTGALTSPGPRKDISPLRAKAGLYRNHTVVASGRCRAP